jgi:very-short-patch-repair endonuclease
MPQSWAGSDCCTVSLFRNWYYLSKGMTDPERAIEPAIARLGERYRAQWLFPHLYHIVDFVLVDRKLILEVDGKSHLTPDQRYKDLVHTIALEKMGYAVVRCTNEEATTDPAGVVASLPERVRLRPNLEELEKALGLLPKPQKRKRAKRSKSVPKLPPKRKNQNHA